MRNSWDFELPNSWKICFLTKACKESLKNICLTSQKMDFSQKTNQEVVFVTSKCKKMNFMKILIVFVDYKVL